MNRKWAFLLTWSALAICSAISFATDWTPLPEQGVTDRWIFRRSVTRKYSQALGDSIRGCVVGADSSDSDNCFEFTYNPSDSSWSIDLPRTSVLDVWEHTGLDTLIRACFIPGDTAAAKSVDGTALRDSSLSAIHFGPACIPAYAMPESALTYDKIAPGGIPESRLAGGAVTGAKLASDIDGRFAPGRDFKFVRGDTVFVRTVKVDSSGATIRIIGPILADAITVTTFHANTHSADSIDAITANADTARVAHYLDAYGVHLHQGGTWDSPFSSATIELNDSSSDTTKLHGGVAIPDGAVYGTAGIQGLFTMSDGTSNIGSFRMPALAANANLLMMHVIAVDSVKFSTTRFRWGDREGSKYIAGLKAGDFVLHGFINDGSGNAINPGATYLGTEDMPDDSLYVVWPSAVDGKHVRIVVIRP